MKSPSRALITTSWDDGHPLDLRVAAILARYGLRGTFYVPLEPVVGAVVDAAGMRELIQMGMEIGSHTVTHPVLTELPDNAVDRELRESRRKLEDMLGLEVTSFCYPKGKFNRRVSRRAALAGYQVCRTTVDFRTDLAFDPIRMPVTTHLFRHSAAAHYRHGLRYRNWNGLWNWCGRFGCETDPDRSVARMLDRVSEAGGVFHLWGHSWEIEQYGLWQVFERAAAYMGQAARTSPHAIAMINSEVGHVAKA